MTTTPSHSIGLGSENDAHRLVTAWLSHRWEECHSALEALRKIAGGGVGWVSLKRLVEKESLAHRIGDRAIVVSSSRCLPEIIDGFGKAISSIATKARLTPPYIIIAVMADEKDNAFASKVSSDLSYVNMPERHLSDVKVLTHEVAHAALVSGNRFLDEGFADLFSDPRPSDPDAYKGPPLREMLTRKHANDVQFSSLVSHSKHLQGLRMRGRDLVTTLIDRCQPEGIRSLFQDIYEHPASTVDRIEGVLDCSLEDWDNQPTPQLSRITEAVIAAQIARDHAVLLECANAAIELAADSPSWRPAQTGAVAIYAALREYASQGLTVDPSILAAADHWVEEAQRKGLPASRRAALDGHRELIALLVAHSHDMGTRALLSAGRVERAYKLALSLDPTDIEAQTSLRFLERINRSSAPALVLTSPRGNFEEDEKSRIVLELRNIYRQTAQGFRLQIDEFLVRRGEKIALIGPNGSGKSTLIEAIVGLVRYEGTRTMFGVDMPAGPLSVPYRCRVGALVTNAPLSRSLTVRETIRMVDAIYMRSDAVVYEAMSLLEIESSRVGELSRGQMQRLLVYLAAGHDPELLLLDEASIGLDRRHSAALRGLIFGPWGAERSVVFCSHIADDLQQSDRVVAMANGSIMAIGGFDELVGRLGWVWKGVMEGVNADACQAIMRSLPQFKRSRAEGRSVVCYGGPLFGRAFSDFAASQPFSAMSLAKANVGDVIDDLSR